MVLQLRRVAKAYHAGGRRVPVLDGVDLSVGAGEQVVLTGASGAGKTTLLNLAGLLDRPDAGEVVFDGVRVHGGASAFASSLRLRQVGFVFQHHYLAPDLTVWENAMFPALAARTEAAHLRVSDLLDLVGLAALADRLPRELSGGEQQRACLARALVNSPRLILADEPTASLDAENAVQVARLLGHAQTEGAAVLVATHEPSRFPDATRIDRLKDGRLTVEALP